MSAMRGLEDYGSNANSPTYEVPNTFIDQSLAISWRGRKILISPYNLEYPHGEQRVNLKLNGKIARIFAHPDGNQPALVNKAMALRPYYGGFRLSQAAADRQELLAALTA